MDSVLALESADPGGPSVGPSLSFSREVGPTAEPRVARGKGSVIPVAREQLVHVFSTCEVDCGTTAGGSVYGLSPGSLLLCPC
jgi:hypothetical protein